MNRMIFFALSCVNIALRDVDGPVLQLLEQPLSLQSNLTVTFIELYSFLAVCRKADSWTFAGTSRAKLEQDCNILCNLKIDWCIVHLTDEPVPSSVVSNQETAHSKAASDRQGPPEPSAPRVWPSQPRPPSSSLDDPSGKKIKRTPSWPNCFSFCFL